MIEKERREWVVVTSDREIMDHAWKNSSVPIPSDQFREILDRNDRHNIPRSPDAPALPCTPSSAKSTGESGKEGKGDGRYTNDRSGRYPDEEYCEPPQKGNPRQRSKKEKALIRILNKL